VPYYPPEYYDTFEHDLLLSRGFTLSNHKPPMTDQEVIRSRWIVTPTGVSYSDQTFHTFFDHSAFRSLLRCILSQPVWKEEELLQRFGGTLPKEQSMLYLSYCKEQAFLEQRGSDWYRGPQLQQIHNLGHTFEWVVMEYLRMQHKALVRRCVQLHELPVPGDLDVVALCKDFSMMVECKSSASTVTPQSIHMFVERATTFRSDIALFLIDTSNEEALRHRLQQMKQEICQPEKSSLRQIQGGSIVYWVANNLFLANTAGGIRTSLDATIQLGLALKALIRF
jgi:Holliday junction resolvase